MTTVEQVEQTNILSSAASRGAAGIIVYGEDPQIAMDYPENLVVGILAGFVDPQKIQRNRVYTACGVVILISLVLLPGMTLVFHIKHVLPHTAPGIFFETTSLLAFGIAWLVKGETFLRDRAR